MGYGSSTPYDAPSVRARQGTGGMLNGRNRDTGNAGDRKDPLNQPGSFKDMASYSPVAAAIRVIVEECVQTEQSCPGTIWVEGGDTETETLLNDLFQNNLECEDVIRSQFWWLVTDGNNFEKLLIGPEGVQGWRKAVNSEVERCVDDNRRLVGFKWAAEEPPEFSSEEKKADYLTRLDRAPERARWVCAADKIHNGSAILADLRRTDYPENVWGRFSAGREGTVRWYRQVHDRLAGLGFRAPIMDELRDVADQLERWVEPTRAR